MERKYREYTEDDFLRDEDFLLWRICPTEETDLFWADVIENCPEQDASIARAIRILDSVTINHDELSKDEEDEILLATRKRFMYSFP